VRNFPAPRKRFGQHFLSDASVIQSIVSGIAPTRTDHLVEIGPGRGALTHALLRVCGRLDVVEIDRDLIASLRALSLSHPQFQVHQADALTFDFASLSGDSVPLRLVGNLPYNISTPLIFHLLSAADKVQDMHFMLQKEVADRLCASPGTKDYGRLSVMVQYQCQTETLFDVGPEAFDPPPKVNSSVIRLTPFRRKPQVADSFEHFSKLVKTAFSQRRKTLRNNLKNMTDLSLIADYPLDLQRRPEQVSVAEFVGLSNFIFNGMLK